MKEKQKSAKTFRNFLDYNSQLPCNKHPYPPPPSVGICPYCLNDRLVKLVCSDCGELRVSSCSCSEISSSYRNSCSYVDVGRISFLIENDKVDPKRRSFFLRSSSNCGEANKSHGFWRIRRMFTKRGNKGRGGGGFPDENSCFRSGEEQCGPSNGCEARKGDGLDGENWFGRRNRMEVDETGFIELKLNDSWYHPCGGRASDDGRHEEEIVASLRGNGVCGNRGGGGSCRITMNEKGFKQGTTNWKWISKFR